MDVIQPKHPEDLILITAQAPTLKRTVTRWVRRGQLERLHQAVLTHAEVEIHQVAAYGTPDWKVARETTMP